ncbi:hypothetical protein GHT06_016509 [Daphnia sinensis]|uniref:Amino acid transporter transmembrane domain-containing protein n=1 Tax=Daphnia sinensis TaxID=1820382 RepID=A0AAD5L6N7_9CRUS|nr:hypothetical protein GHT06_016509 [Daphnia sinensis]
MNRDVDAILPDSDVASEVTLDSSSDVGRSSPTLKSLQAREGSSKQRTRRPFHFQSTISANRAESPVLVDAVPYDNAQEATYSRYKYYQRLRGPTIGDDQALLIPDHVVPSIFFYPYIPGTVPLTGKQSSLITIFAVWNTMMGTSLLSMPWAVEQAGLVAGLSLIVVMAGICFYTAFCILQVYGIYGEKENLADFPDLCMFLLGRAGQWVSVLFSALSLLGASAVYWVLMSNFLYHTVKYVYDLITTTSSVHLLTIDDNSSAFNLFCPDPIDNLSYSSLLNGPLFRNGASTFDKIWNLDLTVPIYMALLLLPLICLKSATFFTKFNALGTVSVFYIMAFVVTKASQWGVHVEFNDTSSPFYVPLLRSNFPALSGMLSLALYLHNCVVSIMKNNRHQESNGRDLSIAYILVALTYLGIGATFYLTFPLEKDCIEDNLLNNFSRSDTLTVIARVFLLFQMMTVFPLLAYILRTQILYAFFNSIYPSFSHVFSLNVALLTICVIFAVFLPQVGTITRFSGALCGLVYVFTLPSILYVVSYRKQNNGHAPAWVYIVHGLIILCGLLNLIAQFIVTN